MKNKKKTIMLIMVITISMVLLTYNKSYSYKMNDNEPEETEIERKEFGIYLQESGENYTETDTFPIQGYLLNTTKTECHEYGTNNVIQNAVTQSLTNGVIDGSIIVTSQKSMYCKIYFDKDEKPTVTSFNIAGKTSSGDSLSNGFTYNTGVYTINWNDGDVAQYCLSNSNNSCTDWHALNKSQKTSKTITIENNTYTNTEGPKTIYAYIKDKANNISSITSISTANITVDQTPPKVTLTLTGTSASPFVVTSGYTHTTKVNYTSTITETNPESYCVGENSCSNYSASSSTSIRGNTTIANTEILHTVIINVKDKAGNVGSKTQSIILDTQNPIITLSNEKATETSITVTVNASDTHGIAGITCTAVGNGGTKTGTYTNNTCIFSDLKDGTQYTITGEATDASGRKGTSNSISVTTVKVKLTRENIPSKLFNGVNPNGLSDKLLGDMYRFVGTKDTVDNWICFGYNNINTDCKAETSDYMYRIIGITEDGQLKLIKNTVIREGTTYNYGWFGNNTGEITWPQSDIYKRLNGQMAGITQGSNGNTNLFIDSTTSNVQYIKSSGTEEQTKWYNKIDIKHKWLYGGIYHNYVGQTADNIYKIESGQLETVQYYGENPSKWAESIEAAIGLMYISDYYYSYVPYMGGGTDSSSVNCHDAGCIGSWLFLSKNGEGIQTEEVYEWTMTRDGFPSSDSPHAHVVGQSGRMYYFNRAWSAFVRPAFYLYSNIKIIDGSGVSSDPFIIAA